MLRIVPLSVPRVGCSYEHFHRLGGNRKVYYVDMHDRGMGAVVNDVVNQKVRKMRQDSYPERSTVA